jgi:hypothetical protein
VLNETAQTAITPDECHAVFQRWLGDEYDLDVLDIMLCTLAAERLTGHPHVQCRTRFRMHLEWQVSSCGVSAAVMARWLMRSG